MDVVEVIRRWQEGNSQRHIASGTGLSRDTVRKYLAAAVEAGVRQEGSEPTEEQLSWLLSLSRSGPREAVAPAEDLLESWFIVLVSSAETGTLGSAEWLIRGPPVLPGNMDVAR